MMVKIYFISLSLAMVPILGFASNEDCKSAAKLLLNHGKFTEATIQYTRCLDEYGDDGQSFYGIAVANFYQGLYDESLSYISKAEQFGVNDARHLRERIGEEQFQQEERLEKLNKVIH